ncbi:MAG: hypothetical protein NTW29_08400 [Bacteroidetes bacterium]|nr:hypothetical protein [Bacteroidota bacterium]
MNFKIENGTNICTIGLSGIGSYIRFNYPLTVVWYDCRGSVGKYFSVLPYNEEYRTTVRNKINANLTQDFTGNEEGLYELLHPLFPLFQNGEYGLSFYSNKEKEFFQYQSSYDNFTQNHYFPFEVVFAQKTTDFANQEVIRGEHKAYLKKMETVENNYTLDVLEYSTHGIYTGEQSFFATQPMDNIDQDRVRYFEERITSGERPFAVIFNAYLAAADTESSYFILDGHHKLLAYQELGIYPPIALITHFPKNKLETAFDVELLSERLYPWQVEHILKHWEGKDEYIEQALQNPDSRLHSIVKNGDHEEYHDNGKLKHKAFYKNDKVDGPSMYWYDNGQVQKEHYYKNGVRSGTWRDYYRSGKIEFIQPYNEEGICHGILVSFFENGQKKMEQELENGVNKDGDSYKVWFENGDIDSALTYKNGHMIVRKNWNNWGEFVNHEVFNEETKKLENIEIPPGEKYVYESKGYKARQAEIKEIIQGMRRRKEMKEKEGGDNKIAKKEPTGFWDKLKNLFK